MKFGAICPGSASLTAIRLLSNKSIGRPSGSCAKPSGESAPARGFTRGVPFERQAQSWLEHQGLVLIAQNFRSRGGEIDLIMGDGATVVFIEVRKRGRTRFGNALTSITPKKVSRIRHAAETFLKKNVKKGNQPPVCRFDVVTFDGEPPDQQLRWVRNAF